MAQVTKSYLYLGSGDFSAPLKKAQKHSRYDQAKAQRNGDISDQNNPAARVLVGIDLTATEFRSKDATYKLASELNVKLQTLFPDQEPKIDILGNFYNLVNIGCRVLFDFDATKYPLAEQAKKWDRIYFMNPHTDTYGDGKGGVQDMQAVVSNTGLVEGILREARSHLTRNGILKIDVCGWPFVTRGSNRNKWDFGMDFTNPSSAEKFASNLNMKFLGAKDMGRHSVARNNGLDYFLADVTRLKFGLKG